MPRWIRRTWKWTARISSGSVSTSCSTSDPSTRTRIPSSTTRTCWLCAVRPFASCYTRRFNVFVRWCLCCGRDSVDIGKPAGLVGQYLALELENDANNVNNHKSSKSASIDVQNALDKEIAALVRHLVSCCVLMPICIVCLREWRISNSTSCSVGVDIAHNEPRNQPSAHCLAQSLPRDLVLLGGTATPPAAATTTSPFSQQQQPQ